MYKGRRVFRLGSGWVVFFAALTAVFVVGAYMTYQERGWTWVSVGLALFAVVLGVGSIVETLVMRIELTDEAMLVRDLRGRKEFARQDIERITQEKGGPPAILLRDGRWIKLPPVASGLPNSVRAWLKAP
jgi:hypothetical protein